MYTDYTFYKETYLIGRTAVLDTANFPYFERKASKVVQQYTFNRIDANKPILDDVQMCVCELAEHLYKRDKSKVDELSINGVASESNSHYSVSYESAEKRKIADVKAITDIIFLWLSDTGLLYRGLDNVCR